MHYLQKAHLSSDIKLIVLADNSLSLRCHKTYIIRCCRHIGCPDMVRGVKRLSFVRIYETDFSLPELGCNIHPLMQDSYNFNVTIFN